MEFMDQKVLDSFSDRGRACIEACSGIPTEALCEVKKAFEAIEHIRKGAILRFGAYVDYEEDEPTTKQGWILTCFCERCNASGGWLGESLGFIPCCHCGGDGEFLIDRKWHDNPISAILDGVKEISELNDRIGNVSAYALNALIDSVNKS